MGVILGLFLFFVSPLVLGAFSSSRRFFRISTADGLPNGSVSALAQDRMGFLWMGTQGGLVRWDGYEYLLFENEPFREGVLSHNQVQTLFLDGDVLWIGTYGGLNRLDLRTQEIRVYKNIPGDRRSLGHDLIIAIAKDSRGRIWAGTQNGLYCLVDEEKGHFLSYLPDPEQPSGPDRTGALPHNIVRSLYLDNLGRLWVGTTAGGLSLYDAASDAFFTWRLEDDNPQSLPGNAVMSITQDREGLFWLGVWGGGLVSTRNPSEGIFQTWTLEDLRIYTVNAQETGLVRAGTWGGGLFELDPESRSITRYEHNESPGALSNNVVYSMLLDEAGEFWVGTNGGGLNRVNRNEGYYSAHLHDPQNPGSLSAGKVTAVLEDTEGRLWVGVYNGGLNRYDPESQAFVRYANSGNNPQSLPNDIINSIFQDGRGRLWVATNGGLGLYRPETDDFETWPYAGTSQDPAALPDAIIYSLAESPDQRLWVGMYSEGLALLDTETRNLTHYPADPEGDQGPPDGLVYRLGYDNEGRLWAGTNKGLAIFNGDSFEHFSYNPENPRGLSSDTVRNLFRDSQGRMWLATTGGGLLRRDPGQQQFQLYTRNQGLPSNSIRSIVEDSRGRTKKKQIFPRYHQPSTPTLFNVNNSSTS